MAVKDKACSWGVVLIDGNNVFVKSAGLTSELLLAVRLK